MIPKGVKLQPIKLAKASQQKKASKSTGTRKVLLHGSIQSNDKASTAASNRQTIVEPQQLTKKISDRKQGSIYPAWETWQKRFSLMLWEAVALSKNINPTKLDKIKTNNPVRYRNYAIRLKTAASWLNICLPILEHPANGIKPADKMVNLVDFVRCAKACNVKITSKLLEIAKVIERANKQVSVGLHQTMQQGNRITQANELLQEAANKLASELARNPKGNDVTKRLVAKKLHEQPEWAGISAVTIERRIRRKWM